MVRPDIYSYSGPFGIVDSNRKLKSVLWLVRDFALSVNSHEQTK